MTSKTLLNWPNVYISVISVIVTLTTWQFGLEAQKSGTSSNVPLMIVVACWIFWALACLAYLIYRKLNRWLLRPVLFLGVILMIGLTLDKETITSVLVPINALLDRLAASLGSYGKHVPSAGKVGHIVVFACLGYFLLRMHKHFHASIWGVLGFLVLVAVATEGLQLFVPSRSTGIKDLLFDALGLAIAFVLVNRSSVSGSKPESST